MATFPENLNQDASTIKTPAVYDSVIKQWLMFSQLLILNNSGQVTKAQLDAFNRFAATVYAIDGGIDSLGARADAAQTDPTKAATAIAILKGLLQHSLGLGTDATLQDIKAALGVLNGKDYATQTTLAEAKEVLDAIKTAAATAATEATLAAVKAVLDSLDGKVATDAKLEAARALLASLDGKDYATQTTLAAVLAKLADLATAAKQDDAKAVLDAIKTSAAAAATEATLAAVKTALTDGSQKVQLSGSKVRIASAPATGVKTVTGTAAEVFAGTSRKPGRSRLEIANRHPALAIRVGPAGVTDTTGRSVGPLATLALDMDPMSDVPIYAVSEAGALTVEVFEA